MRLFAESGLLPGGWARDVAVEIDEAGRIAGVRADAGPEAGDLRLADAILLPAPANLHSHAFQRALAGLTERRGPGDHDSFWTWRAALYGFLDRLTPEDVESIAALAYMEMLETGFASVGEFHYLHHAPGGAPYAERALMSAAIANAAREAGIGLTLLPVLYMQGGADGRPLAEGQLRFASGLDDFALLLEGAQVALRDFPDARLGVAPHSLRAVSPSALMQAAMLRPAAPIHIHAAEQEAEVAETKAALGARPVQWLLDNIEIGPGWCIVHATHMTDTENRRLAASGAVAGLCPVTEADLGDGIFDGVRWLAAGGAFGVGTDSNVRIDLAAELRLLEYGQRLRDRARALLCPRNGSNGRALFEGALAGGARALGRDSGRIAPGAWADLLALDAAALDLDGLADDTALDAWIFAARRPPVRHVWSAGRHVVRDGRHVARERIEPRARALLRRLREDI